jgi:putative ABC transport system permease protein
MRNLIRHLPPRPQDEARLELEHHLGPRAVIALAPRARALLFEVSPRDPAVITAVAVALLIAAALASLLPALRATRVDPIVALRSD